MRSSLLLKRLALIPLGLVFGLAVIEIGLQLAAWYVKTTRGSELPASWMTGNLRVLCLGDSTTYGLWLERSEAYPHQLEAMWNERTDSPQLEVLNLGFPGTNSSRLVSNLPRLLETFAPDIAIIMIGVNDFWTIPVPLENDEEVGRHKGFLKRHSLVYKLYYMIRRGRDSSELEILLDENPMEDFGGAKHKARFADQEFEMGFLKSANGVRGDKKGLERNLTTIVSQVRAAGTELYLMTYPSRHEVFYVIANGVIRRVARETRTPLIDLTALFKPLCPQRECPEILFPDHHPKAPGYRIIAEEVVSQLSKDWGQQPPVTDSHPPTSR